METMPTEVEWSSLLLRDATQLTPSSVVPVQTEQAHHYRLFPRVLGVRNVCRLPWAHARRPGLLHRRNCKLHILGVLCTDVHYGARYLHLWQSIQMVSTYIPSASAEAVGTQRTIAYCRCLSCKQWHAVEHALTPTQQDDLLMEAEWIKTPWNNLWCTIYMVVAVDSV